MDENNFKWFEYTDLSNEVTHKLPFNFKYFQTSPPLPTPTCHEFHGVRNGVCLTLYTQPYQVKYCGHVRSRYISFYAAQYCKVHCMPTGRGDKFDARKSWNSVVV